MSLLHPSLQEQAIMHAVQNADKDDRPHVRPHDVKPDYEPKPEAWAVKAAKKHPRLYIIFSLFVTFGLIVFILIAVVGFLF